MIFGGQEMIIAITQTREIDLNPNNEFSPSTYPNNNSNSGAQSGFKLYEFSENLPKASFRISRVSNGNYNINNQYYFQTGINTFYTPKTIIGTIIHYN